MSNLDIIKKILTLEVQSKGIQGPQGEPGEGSLPNGGTVGQVLAKASNDNQDVEWVDVGGGTLQAIVAGVGISIDVTDPENPVISVDATAEEITFDDTLAQSVSGGAINGDTVQELVDNFISYLVTVIGGLFTTIGGLDDRVENLEEAGIGAVEPRDRLNVLIGFEDRAKYAILGSGKFSSYDAHGFTVANPGNLPDGGFDIYNEYVPLWQGASPDPEQWTFQEVFTIEDDDAWGGDLVETAICWKGRTPVPFVELTAADSATDYSGNGYGEYPSVIYTNNEYNGDMFMLQRVRYTYNPATGQLLMYRPIYPYETPDDNAFGIDWKIAATTNHISPGSHPLADVDPAVMLKIGKGSGRYLVSRVIVNGFDGTPYCDFNPVENTVDADTVYDPVLDANWTNGSSAFARVLQTEQFVDNWFTDEAIAGRNAHFVGTWSAVSGGINALDGSYIAPFNEYVPTDGDIIRVRTAGSADIGNGTEAFVVGDLIWWDSTTWRRIYVTDPSTKANASHTHEISDVTGLQTALDGKASSTHSHAISDVTGLQTALDNKLDDSQKGANNGLAELDSGGKVPSAQLPSYVDDVLEYANFAALPGTGTTGIIYITQDDNKTYRWSGSAYVEISPSLALGETSSTAYRGDRGKTAYDHSQLTSGNPHNVNKSDVGLSNVDNTSDATKNSATATLTNKRITKRVTTITSSATPTINTDNCDAVTITALATAITSMTTNLSGTPNNFDTLIIRIKDDGTARAITWGASFEAKGVALPTTTVLGKVLTVGFIYDSVTSKWGCIASAQEA